MRSNYIVIRYILYLNYSASVWNRNAQQFFRVMTMLNNDSNMIYIQCVLFAQLMFSFPYRKKRFAIECYF